MSGVAGLEDMEFLLTLEDSFFAVSTVSKVSFLSLVFFGHWALGLQSSLL